MRFRSWLFAAAVGGLLAPAAAAIESRNAVAAEMLRITNTM
jgi:hypothetical protein